MSLLAVILSAAKNLLLSADSRSFADAQDDNLNARP